MAEPKTLSKAEEAYLYLIKNQQQNPNFGKTLFWKMLYFTDFDFYELFERSITSSNYRKINLGPAPCDFDKVIDSLRRKGFIQEVKVKRATKDQTRYLLLKEPSFSQLSAEEFNQLKMSMKRLEGMNAGMVSEYSHADTPYKATKMKELIDYELVFYRSPMFSATKSTQN